ncbi:MAG TPA: family 20 glycosylhydrolase [Sumerlaeia bacterium]|nr:family 20 glycosylhydrolase [Sumerlaeia bacterium]
MIVESGGIVRVLVLLPILLLFWTLPRDGSGARAAGSRTAKAKLRLLNVIPKPARMEPLEGAFLLTPDTKIAVAPNGAAEVEAIGRYLSESLGPATGYDLPLLQGPGDSSGRWIRLELQETGGGGGGAGAGAEGYSLDVAENQVSLRAKTPRGLFWGVQTIRQLLPAAIEKREKAFRETDWTIPCVRIEDAPRYPWRSFMFDSSRSFATIEFVKRYVDLLAYYKINTMNWHLGDDQGWRVRIDKHPRLTEIGAWRQENGYIYGGYYTKDEIRAVVAYAASRYVTVNPYIGMPAHVQAILPAFPELSCTGGPFRIPPRRTPWGQEGFLRDNLCAGNDATFEFLEGVFSEIVPLFPSPYFHIGFDERPWGVWENCPKCQARMRDLELKNGGELQNWFAKRVVDFLATHGKRAIGWEEILHGGELPKTVISQSWLDQGGVGGAVAAAKAGHDTIVSPGSHCYVNFGVNRIDIRKVYSFDPMPQGLSAEEQKRVLGSEVEMWTDECPREQTDRMAFPRAMALAEALWTPADGKDFEDFHDRLRDHYRRLDLMGVAYGESLWREPASWQARWIWLDDPNAREAFFRRVLELKSEPQKAWIDVTADSGYTLFVNGRWVGADESAWRVTEENTCFYDQDAKRNADRYDVTRYNLAPHLRRGPNVIAVAGRNGNGGPGALLAEGEITNADGGEQRFATDGAWKAADKALDDWLNAEGDETQWRAATEYGRPPCEPWGNRISGILERP